ncbi:MAG: hypothetical protein LAO06_20930 [Acidobacteriia bacterium]|nr:hypothetical protein [Terriglobia bacterium]
MRHYLQYHKVNERGSYRPGTFRIVTDKSVDSLPGARIWVITRPGLPPRYCICETFVVEQVGPATDDAKAHQAWATRGTPFEPPVPIDTEAWFKQMRDDAGNFGFGLQRITNVQVVIGLQQILARYEKKGAATRP